MDNEKVKKNDARNNSNSNRKNLFYNQSERDPENRF